MKPSSSSWFPVFIITILAGSICWTCSCGGNSGGAGGGTGPTQNPVPVLTNISPTDAGAESPALTMTANGSGFISSSQIAWNGKALTTMMVSSAELQAQIPAANLASAGNARVTVINPAPGGGTSKALSFTVNLVTTNLSVLDLEGNDLVWDSQHQQIYVSVPEAASRNASTITVVDPIGGSIVSSQSTDLEPQALAISDDDQYVYAGISGDNAVQRFVLPALTPDIKFTVGSDPTFGTPYTPAYIQVQPGAPHTVAVIRNGTSPGSDGGVGIFDDAVMRPSTVCGFVCSSLQWKSDGSQIFVEDNSSARFLYVLDVSASGLTMVQQYGGAFRGLGTHLHLDPSTNYVYTDSGGVVNPATAVPIGSFPTGNNEFQELEAIDPVLKRTFVLTSATDANGQPVFQIQAYDERQFTVLGSFLIPGAVGTPVDFIRWGQAGLVFVTSGSSGGKTYILDGLFVNPSGANDSTNGVAQNPLPTITSVSPITAPTGSSATTIMVTGLDFVGQPTVSWNGSALPTTLLSNGQLQATIPASDLTAAIQASIAVTNPGPGGGTSNSLQFSVNPALAAGNQIDVFPTGGNDLAWSSQSQKIYVSQPAIQGYQSNSIAVVDPVAGTVTVSPFIGSDPARLSISNDNQFLYVGMNGENSVQRLLLPALTPDIIWHLGADPFSGPYFAMDLPSAPGLPHTTAVSLANFDISPSSAGVVIYDDATPRPTSALGWNSSSYSYASLVWGPDATTLYAPPQSFPTDFYVLSVNSSGVSVSKDYPDAFTFPTSDFGIHYDNGTGLIYCDGGQILDPSDGTTVGNFNASGIAVPDSTLDLVFFLGQTSAQVGTSSYTLQAYDQQKFTLVDSLTISNVVGTPTDLIRWGTNGLAFSTRVGAPDAYFGVGPGQLYTLRGTFVKSDSQKRVPSVAADSEHVRKTWGTRLSRK